MSKTLSMSKPTFAESRWGQVRVLVGVHVQYTEAMQLHSSVICQPAKCRSYQRSHCSLEKCALSWSLSGLVTTRKRSSTRNTEDRANQCLELATNTDAGKTGYHRQQIIGSSQQQSHVVAESKLEQ
ncbi:uncharacterized protein LOC110982112 [Acanthaster planci]|uniref:Uncharacterized protein LOC110982112 n=1 Tax=Acanthaster planci TaxID=133434 RepID=A0A8B7YTH2_ACAPL|nr:uncharacterized protein LOC110982112 [Acanthaster planci]